MKTNEQKLLTLLQIAVENGWNSNSFRTSDCIKHWLEGSKADFIIEGCTLCCYFDKHPTEFVSLNDIVTNYEVDEVSFIEALCKEDNELSSYRRQDLQWKIVRKLWDTFEDGEPRPTSQRLEWLFDTFSHILKQEQ